MKLHNLEGWGAFEMFYQEVYNQSQDGYRFLEIGTWLGRSAANMAEIIKAGNKKIHFYVIDNFEGSNGEDTYKEFLGKHGGSSYIPFLKNMIKCDTLESMIPIVGKSAIMADLFEDNFFNFIFIDASHTYEDVKLDVEKWYPKVKSGGLISGHDIWSEPVKRAVVDALASFGVDLNKVNVIQYGNDPIWTYVKE